MKFRIAVCILSLFSIVGFAAHAAAPSDLQAQINAVEKERQSLAEERQKLEAELTKINAESQSLGNTVKSLDTTRKKLTNDLSITQSRIKSADLNLQVLSKSVTEKEQNIKINQEAIRNSLKDLYEYDNRSFFIDLVVNEHLSDVWRDRLRIANVDDTLRDQINLLEETKTELESDKKETEAKIKEQKSLAVELNAQKKVVEDTQSAKSKLLADTKSKEAEYQRLIQEYLKREREMEEDLDKLGAQQGITVNQSLIPAAKHGILSWPLDTVYVTQKFGKTVGASRLYASGTHNGVDFRASVGTPVKAVMSGIVVGADNTDKNNRLYKSQGKPICLSFGRWIMIKHPNGINSIYAHLSAFTVKVGDVVATGDVIGYSGGSPGADGSGYSTGPHLHLGLYATQAVNIEQFVNSRGGCHDIFVPISPADGYLDPLAYLPNL